MRSPSAVHWQEECANNQRKGCLLNDAYLERSERRAQSTLLVVTYYSCQQAVRRSLADQRVESYESRNLTRLFFVSFMAKN